MSKKIKENIKGYNLSIIYILLCIIILGFLGYNCYDYYFAEESILKKHVIVNSKEEYRNYFLIKEYQVSNEELFENIFKENKGYILKKLNKTKKINKIIDKELKIVLEDDIDTCYQKPESYKIFCYKNKITKNSIEKKEFSIIKDEEIKNYIKKYDNKLKYTVNEEGSIFIKIFETEILLIQNKNITFSNFINKLTIEDFLESHSPMKIYYELINKQCILDPNSIQYKKVIEICKSLEELEKKIHIENIKKYKYGILSFSILMIFILIAWCLLVKELNKLILNSKFNYLLVYLINLINLPIAGLIFLFSNIFFFSYSQYIFLHFLDLSENRNKTKIYKGKKYKKRTRK